MKSVLAYSKTHTFQLFVKEAKVTRRYEEKDYDFVASDLQLDLTDGKELYDLVNAGEEIFIAIKDGDVTKFYGTIQFEGSGYNPETEIYSFTALHISKKVFGLLKDALHNTQWYSDIEIIQDVSLEFVRFNMALYDAGFAPYANDQKYTMRDRLIDIAKQYRFVMGVLDDLSAIGKYQLTFQKKADLKSIVHTGYDELISEYNEEDCNAEYEYVLFPCRINEAGEIFSAYAIHSLKETKVIVTSSDNFEPRDYHGVRMEFIKVGDKLNIPDNCLDLRVPSEVYGDVVKEKHPFIDLPMFTFIFLTDEWTETPEAYCLREFQTAISPYKEITTLFSEMLPVNPCETINIVGGNSTIHEIEDDHVNETTKTISRKYL